MRLKEFNYAVKVRAGVEEEAMWVLEAERKELIRHWCLWMATLISFATSVHIHNVYQCLQCATKGEDW